MHGRICRVLSDDANLAPAWDCTVRRVLRTMMIESRAGVTLLRRVRSFSPHAIKIMAWGGIRGGISVALALSLPRGPERDVLLSVTYTVVAFSILVQGLSVGPLVRRLYAR